MKYLLSIIVPTKDRYKYLKHLICLIESFNFKDIEFVIQDNTYDNSEILEFIESHSFSYFKYYHHKEKLTLEQNVNKAVLNSTGEYVCCIGDDDGVTKNIEACAKWMKRENIEALRCRKNAYYRWPDYIEKGASISYEDAKDTYAFLQPIEELNKVCSKGMQNTGLMPKLYGGIVRRDILDKIYNKGGTYFPGAAGDMANAVALCFFVKKYVVVDYHVVFPGASVMHGGGIIRRKNQMATLDEVDFISQEVRDNWEKCIPRIWHTCFVWPESGTKALRYMGKEDFIEKINYDYMLAHFASQYNLSFLKLCLPYAQNKYKLFKYYLKFRYVKFLVKAKALISLFFFWEKRFIYKVKIKEDVENIIEAEEFLSQLNDSVTYTKH